MTWVRKFLLLLKFICGEREINCDFRGENVKASSFRGKIPEPLEHETS